MHIRATPLILHGLAVAISVAGSGSLPIQTEQTLF